MIRLVPRDDAVVVGVDIPGGITRAESVKNGLKYFVDKNTAYERLVVVEAARPLVTYDQLNTILTDNHPSATYALPLVSTIVNKNGTYLNREDYYKLSTPVGFDYELFRDAYLGERDYNYTDDTRVMYEQYGIKPFFIQGAENLLKLTYQSDLAVLEILADRYKDEMQ